MKPLKQRRHHETEYSDEKHRRAGTRQMSTEFLHFELEPAGEQRGAAGEKALRRLLASADMEAPGNPDGDNADKDKSDDDK